MAVYRSEFDGFVASGKYRPLVIPHFLFGLSLMTAYLAIPHVNRPWLYRMRWPVMAWIIIFEIKTICETSSMSMATGFGVGLVSMWFMVWAATWLVWNDPQRDAKRINRRKKIPATGEFMNGNARGDSETNMGTTRETMNGHVEGNPGLRQRTKMNEMTNGAAGKAEADVVDGDSNGHAAQPNIDPDEEQYEYYWEPYPTNGSLYQRLDWVLDLVLNFRGPGWSWSIHSNPSYPPHVAASLGEPVKEWHKKSTTAAGVKRFASRQQLLRARLPKFIAGYLLLDTIKVVLMKDPYFVYGPNSYSLPPHLAWMHPILLGLVRRFLSIAAVLTALETIFLLAPLVFCIILTPKVLNVRGEVWMYPTTFGTLEPILSKGLNGLWSGFWHQTFRFAFSAPTKYFIDRKMLDPKAQSTRLLGLFIAFTISGALHVAGSISQFPQTKPWEPMFFFWFQAVGVAFQMWFCSTFKSHIGKIPLSIRRAGNLAYTLICFYISGPLLVDDFARGGIWLVSAQLSTSPQLCNTCNTQLT